MSSYPKTHCLRSVPLDSNDLITVLWTLKRFREERERTSLHVIKWCWIFHAFLITRWLATVLAHILVNYAWPLCSSPSQRHWWLLSGFWQAARGLEAPRILPSQDKCFFRWNWLPFFEFCLIAKLHLEKTSGEKRTPAPWRASELLVNFLGFPCLRLISV